LATIYAYLTARALSRVDLRVVVGFGHRLLDAPLSDTPQDGTTAPAAVADIEDIFDIIADSVDEANFLCLIEESQRFLP
jgi:hypothetical protein